VVLDIEIVPNAEFQTSVILGCRFLVTSNALINCKSGMMKLSFNNMSIDSNIFLVCKHNMIVLVILVGDFAYNELEFDHVNEFAIEYKSFFMDDEPKYDVFDFNMCLVDFITDVIFAYDTSTVSLDLKPLPASLKYAFLGLDESLHVIIVYDLDNDQEEKLLKLPKENE